MIIWNSKLAHMGGYLTKSKAIPVSMKRLAERSYEDIENIKNDLETHGVALVKDVMTSKQMKDIYAQFCQDVSKIYDISASERVFDNPDFVFGRQNKGGGAWTHIVPRRRGTRGYCRDAWRYSKNYWKTTTCA